jgi:hypothetical protein
VAEPAYIAIDKQGYITLFWGDGTEAERTVIWRGPRATYGKELVDNIEALKAWAEENGYTVVVPAYDLHPPDVEIELSEQEINSIDLNEADTLLDDIYYADDSDLDEDGDAY